MATNKHYIDFSQVAATDDDAIQSLLEMGTNKGDGTQGLSMEAVSQFGDGNFPVQLHYALGEMVVDGMEHIASWAPHGRCFKVHKQKEFVELILRRSFRQSKFTSFQRQLNIYGFSRITTGKDKGAYYHQFFLRGKIELARRLTRMNVKGQGPRRPGSWKNDPDFYAMPPLPGPASKSDQDQKVAASKTKVQAPSSSAVTLTNFPTVAETSLSQPRLELMRLENHNGLLSACNLNQSTVSPLSGYPPIPQASPFHGFILPSRPEQPAAVVQSMSTPSELNRALELQAYVNARRQVTEMALLERYLLLQNQPLAPSHLTGGASSGDRSQIQAMLDALVGGSSQPNLHHQCHTAL